MRDKMIFDRIKQSLIVKDEEFDSLYPTRIREMSNRHWTPVEVAVLAARYLADQPGKKVLDIGSGCGKFCHIGGALTKGHFYGVEQRPHLVETAKNIVGKHNLKNITFMEANITAVPFSCYDSFYFFNPFIENINTSAVIDTTVDLKKDLFFHYSEYVKNQLSMTPEGTRLVTYWSLLNEVPENFNLEFSVFNGKLNFWKKGRSNISNNIFA